MRSQSTTSPIWRPIRLALAAGLPISLAALVSACATTPNGHSPSSAASTPSVATTAVEQSSASTQTERSTERRAGTRAELRADAPIEYVVKRGDTLWDIANRFLRNPIFWPEIWLENPQVANPHLIYPGDILRIVTVGGEPRVTLTLEPRIRREVDLDRPIDAFLPFMFRPHVVDDDTLERAPYILSARDERVVMGPNDTIYVREMPSDAQAWDTYHIVRRDHPLTDPETGELLGIATIPVGEAEVVRATREGEPVTVMRIVKGEREALRGDRLLPLFADPDFNFQLTDPPQDAEATVIALFEALTQIGRYQIAIINRGEREGIKPGQVFRIWEAGRTVRDTVRQGAGELVTLPEETVGDAMVFATFEKVSYVLVIQSTHPIREGYRMYHPRAER
ncbi:MAG: LysM peptidoglycan-binding domain-containing protein [Thioalkalivibrionaceae bacterium]